MAAHLTGIHSAIKMLNSRIRVLHHYLLAMQKGTAHSPALCVCVYVRTRMRVHMLHVEHKGSFLCVIWSRRTHEFSLPLNAGDFPHESSLLRQVSSLLRRLPVIESGKFEDDFLMVRVSCSF